MSNAVTAVAAAPPACALARFEDSLRFETDCHDVHASLSSGRPGFVLLDVRSPELFEQGHVAGALSLPHRKIIASRMATFEEDTLFVTYCAGPHCNGAVRAAIGIARLGHAVKIMPGGISGWRDEGFALVTGP